jgi:hypothetical protein
MDSAEGRRLCLPGPGKQGWTSTRSSPFDRSTWLAALEGGRSLSAMTVVFQASHDEPISSRLEHWRHVVDETFGPAHLRPPSTTHVPEQLVGRPP